MVALNKSPDVALALFNPRHVNRSINSYLYAKFMSRIHLSYVFLLVASNLDPSVFHTLNESQIVLAFNSVDTEAPTDITKLLPSADIVISVTHVLNI